MFPNQAADLIFLAVQSRLAGRDAAPAGLSGSQGARSCTEAGAVARAILLQGRCRAVEVSPAITDATLTA